jgi:hypothetical protein
MLEKLDGFNVLKIYVKRKLQMIQNKCIKLIKNKIILKILITVV